MINSLRFLAALVAAGALTLSGCGHQTVDEPQEILAEIHEEISRILGPVRLIEARLTLDTGWAPCAAEPRKAGTGAGCSIEALMQTELSAPRCSPQSSPTPVQLSELIELSRRLEKSSLPDRGASLAALPLLIDADENRTAATITMFNEIGSQEALTNRSAAYLHLAGITNRPHLFLESLENSSDALERRTDDPRARFNLALVLSRLHLATTAHDAWQRYVETAPADGWRVEAQSFQDRTILGTYRERWRSEVEPALRQASRAGDLDRLRTIVTRHRQVSREWAERELLSEWAEASGSAGSQILVAAGRVGAALAETGGDRMLLDGTEIIAAAGETRGGAARLRTGHDKLAAGYDSLYRHWRLEQARDHFRQARGALDGSPFALWADFYLGLITYYQGDYDRARAELESLRSRVDRKRYPALAGRILWIQGLIAASSHRLEGAAELYRQSLEIYCTIGEDENLAVMHALRGEVLSKLGRYEESWQHLYNALARVDRVSDPIRHHAILEVAILNARRQGLYRAGLAFADEHLHVAGRTRSAQILHYAFVHRASLRYALGDLQGAKADLAEAARAAQNLEDPSLRQRSAADFELVNAEIEVEADPARAVSLLDQTIRQYERTRYAYLLPQAYGARAQAYLQLGQPKLAEKDLDHQIRIYEDSADETLRDVFRLSLLDQAAPAFDRMIELQATTLDQPSIALEYCERGRYRALLDAWTRASLELPAGGPAAQWKSFESQGLQRRMPPDTAILEFALLEDHLLSWVITRSNITMVVQKVRQGDVRRQIGKLSRGLARERYPPVGHELHDLLLRPVEELLGEVSNLVIVPDKDLFSVPFEVLVDRRTGRFLLEDRTVSYSPSASLHLRLREKLSKAESVPPQRIVSATGAQDGGARYRRLPEAVTEARSIAALYPRGSFLPNPGKQRFLTALSQSQILHFSGHAIPNVEQPFASRLILADTRTESIELYAYELYDQSFPHLQLVTLSACGTADPATPTLGVAATLSGPFLAAGVPQVIGSQWRVADGPTHLFFAAFHRRFAQGADAASALRATKLQFLHGDDRRLASPRVWGAFVLVGG
jgi:CHAT domain-containing protein